MSGNLVTLKLRMYPVSFVNSKFSLELLGSTKLLFLASISKKIQFRDTPLQFVGKKTQLCPKNIQFISKNPNWYQRKNLVSKKTKFSTEKPQPVLTALDFKKI